MINLNQLPISGYRCYRIEFLCHKGKDGCRYWMDDFDLGNCVLRCDREHAQREVAASMGISFQAVQQLENYAYVKIAKAVKALHMNMDDYTQEEEDWK